MHPLRWALLVCAYVCPNLWAQPTTGSALFETHCSTCHQTDGSGTVGLAPALKGEHWQALNKDRQYLLTVLTKGLSGRIEVNGQLFVGNMPSFASQMDDGALTLLAQHVRTLQGDAQANAPYSADEVSAVRQLAGSPPQTRQKRQALLGGN
jgi:mono/diheme cytochrome c family protein